MNITLDDINKRRNEIFAKEPKDSSKKDSSQLNKPRKRSVTEINSNYLEIGTNTESVVNTNVNTRPIDNSIYMTYINKKLGVLDKKLNSLINLSKPNSYMCLFIVIVILFIGMMVLNDYLALKYTTISLE